MKKISIQWNKYGLVFAFVIWCVVVTILEPAFLTTSNLLNVLRQISIVSVIAIGAFLAILTGGIDLSVGSVAALAGVVAAILMKRFNMAVAWGIMGGVLIGALIGAANGIMITKMKMAAFIATLITMNFAKGLAFIFTDGVPISGLPSPFVFLGRGYLWFLPFPIVIMAAVFLVTGWVMRQTRFGMRVYGIGGNPEAVRLSGVNVHRYLQIVYLVSGAAAGLGGVLLASRLDSGTPNVGETYVFDAITAVVLGGTSLAGGSGRVVGVFLGSIFMGTLGNGLNLLNVPSYWQLIAKAVLLAVAVSIDIRAKNEK
jgi:ribose/xylose/arabinose/galactoside ABC-type transport system permease subunit